MMNILITVPHDVQSNLGDRIVGSRLVLVMTSTIAVYTPKYETKDSQARDIDVLKVVSS